MYSFDAQNRFCVREKLKEKKMFYTLCSQTNDYWFLSSCLTFTYKGLASKTSS